MREIELSLNQTQKIRLKRALEKLEYKPEVGDIVVGRVSEVAQKRWRLDIHYSQDAVLMLSSMNLPDGIQLERGQLLTVPPYLVRRRKQHFHHLEQYGVDLILGCNGFIWVGEHVEARDDMVEDQVSKPEQQNIKSNKNSISLEEQEQTYTPIETRQSICRIANAVRVLSILGFNITIEVIMDTMNLSSSLNLDIHEMLGSEFCVLVAEGEAERRSLTKKKG
ncbi:exosome complex component rrp4 like protein [Quercus suber]|uniref:Exosome complex component rrp4 like protein n=1 Tax=Quercus suber TaxID=58331 RepID=A0AAW0LQC1_QUESU